MNYLSIEEKIKQARELYNEFGDALKNDPAVQRLSESLMQKVSDSQKAMIELGVAEACRRCDEEEGGSCCGAGIENRYDPSLLLVNLLYGETLPDKRRFEDSCYFLGARGCSLKARLVLCINYLCLRIQRMLEPHELVKLQTITGEEIDTVFLLNEAIKKVISR